MNFDHKNKRRAPESRTGSCTSTPAQATTAAKALRGRPRKDALGRVADQRAFVGAATGIMREAGTAGLTARAVAARAGTAVGSVYAAFPNLEALRLAVNTATMGLLRETLAAALATSTGMSLQDRLLGLADVYMGFADTHATLWAALFEPRTMAAPPAMAEETTALFALLDGVLCDAGCAASDAPAFGRALWAAVHGTLFLAVQGSLGPVGRNEAASLVHTLVTAIVGGIPRQSSVQQAAVARSRQALPRSALGKPVDPMPAKWTGGLQKPDTIKASDGETD